MSGTTYIDMVTCSISLDGLGATPLAVNHPMPALEGWEDTDSKFSPQLGLLIFVSNCLPLVSIELSHLAFLPNMCIHYILLSIPYTVDLLAIMPNGNILSLNV